MQLRETSYLQLEERLVSGRTPPVRLRNHAVGFPVKSKQHQGMWQWMIEGKHQNAHKRESMFVGEVVAAAVSSTVLIHLCPVN